MTRRTAIAIVPVGLLAGGAGKGSSQPAQQLEITEFAARRTSARVIEIDGVVRNTGGQPLTRARLIFYLLSPGGSVISTQRGAIQPETLEPGEDATFTGKRMTWPGP
ncbi:MAG: FxLYD domain-containing protein [bacterium]|jgi:hypothetical protein